MFKITPKRLLQIRATLRGTNLLLQDIWFVLMRYFVSIGVVTRTTLKNLRYVWSRRGIYKFFPYQTKRGYKAIRHHKDWKKRGVHKLAKAVQYKKKHTSRDKRNKKRKV